MTVLALQIGAREFAAARLPGDGDDEEIHRVTIPDRHVWECCRELLLEVAEGADGEVAAVGIASPGPIDLAAGVIGPVDIREWRAGFNIQDAVWKAFPGATVPVMLDGLCLAVAERAFGSVGETMDALAVNITHRVIAGVMVGGFGVVGRTGNAGHLGHVLIPGFDDLCECGGRGCLEAVASGPALLRWSNNQGWQGNSLEALVESAVRSDDDVALAALGRAGTALGRAIASVAPLLDLEMAVVGGTLSKAGPALWKPLKTAVATHARLGFLTGLQVVPSELDDWCVLAGAAVMAARCLGDSPAE